jgi:hypothetical protein
MEKHLSRQQLIEAAQDTDRARDRHLDSCAECRRLVDLLKAFPVAGRPPLPDAPAAWISRAASLAEHSSVLERVQSVMARLIFDSWAVPQPIGVRGRGTIDQRRVRFESEFIVLDLRAEKNEDGWAFVAQITGERPLTEHATLKVGTKELQPDSGGIFQWASRRPPAEVSVRAGALEVKTPGLSWKAPRKD